jgi:outer membrane protein
VGAQGVYDPVLSGSVNYQDSDTPLPPGEIPGVSSIEEKQWNYNVGLAGKLPTGASYDLFGSSTRTYGNLTSNFVYTGSAGISGTQPLLKNFGFGVNAATIRIARESKTIAIQNFVQFVMTTINSVSHRLLRIGVRHREPQGGGGKPGVGPAVTR